MGYTININLPTQGKAFSTLRKHHKQQKKEKKHKKARRSSGSGEYNPFELPEGFI